MRFLVYFIFYEGLWTNVRSYGQTHLNKGLLVEYIQLIYSELIDTLSEISYI